MSDNNSISRTQIELLITKATETLKYAYAPYSRFRVGAAVLTKAGNIFTGCNVENASYGLSMCAERNAVATAVAAEGGDSMKIAAIAIVNDRQIPCSPCGACRQVIWEFGKDAAVVFQGQGEWHSNLASELLPAGFSF
ncbi:cytidine deaminase [Myxosarcina sp. GI1]|uniref:cytidine deaminase n=1 Tax=Myxosarcina sp. GI1 TaxID=1541065 RepID=UPI0005686F40|nr:cytidine deaminase [Myxosarcina sp. GI1]